MWDGQGRDVASYPRKVREAARPGVKWPCEGLRPIHQQSWRFRRGADGFFFSQTLLRVPNA